PRAGSAGRMGRHRFARRRGAPRGNGGDFVILALLLLAAGVRTEKGIELIRIAGGTFRMGCVPGDRLCLPDEKPPREVTVPPFWMARTEVTVADYDRCMAGGGCTPRHPKRCR